MIVLLKKIFNTIDLHFHDFSNSNIIRNYNSIHKTINKLNFVTNKYKLD